MKSRNLPGSDSANWPPMVAPCNIFDPPPCIRMVPHAIWTVLFRLSPGRWPWPLISLMKYGKMGCMDHISCSFACLCKAWGYFFSGMILLIFNSVSNLLLTIPWHNMMPGNLPDGSGVPYWKIDHIRADSTLWMGISSCHEHGGSRHTERHCRVVALCSFIQASN